MKCELYTCVEKHWKIGGAGKVLSGKNDRKLRVVYASSVASSVFSKHSTHKNTMGQLIPPSTPNRHSQQTRVMLRQYYKIENNTSCPPQQQR